MEQSELTLLKTVVRGSITAPIIIGDLHYGTLTGGFEFGDREAEDLISCMSCTVELVFDCQSIIGAKWHDAEFVSLFAAGAMRMAALRRRVDGFAHLTNDGKALRATCRCRFWLEAEALSLLSQLAKDVKEFYLQGFADAVAAKAEARTPVEFDPPGTAVAPAASAPNA